MYGNNFKDAVPFYLACFGLHCLALAMWVIASLSYAPLWGIGIVAYTLGLRHAFDADHIAAIDNTVRKLINQNKKSAGVGFYFSLGHSTVVFLIACSIALSVRWTQAKLPIFEAIGGKIGTVVSSVFLLVIAVVNLAILVHIIKLVRHKQTDEINEAQLNKMLDSRGFLTRIIRPVFRFVNKQWHMYPVGFLFGLGFDTATEIALIALSITTAKSSISVITVLCLPLLFAAGMSIMDTTDSVMMSHAYKWAFEAPMRKLYYNLVVTTISVTAAIIIGLVEIMQLVPSSSLVVVWIQNLDTSNLGWLLVMIFGIIWGVCYAGFQAKKVRD